MVNGDPANFHPVKLGEPGHIELESDAIVSKPYDFHHRTLAAVFEDRSEGFPMSIRRPRNGAACNPIAFVAFHHGGLTFNGPDAFREIATPIVHK
jgi:hypothetical protein